MNDPTSVDGLEHLLRELKKASPYCIGPKSAPAHDKRIKEVEQKLEDAKAKR